MKKDEKGEEKRVRERGKRRGGKREREKDFGCVFIYGNEVMVK